MKAAVLHQFGMPLTIQDISTPIPADDEVLVQTMACGIDGTDLKLLDGFGYTPELPFIMGHEIAGVVAFLASRAGSPVRWQQWDPEVLQRAKDARRLVFAFIGSGHYPGCVEALDAIDRDSYLVQRLTWKPGTGYVIEPR